MNKTKQLTLAALLLAAAYRTHAMDDGFDRDELERAIEASMLEFGDAYPVPAIGDGDADQEMQRILWQDLAHRRPAAHPLGGDGAASDDDELQRVIALSRTDSAAHLARLAAEEEEMARAIALSTEMAYTNGHLQRQPAAQPADLDKAPGAADGGERDVAAQMRRHNEAFLRRMEEEMRRKREGGEGQ